MRRGHGGCGRPQPRIKRSGLQLTAELAQGATDESQERKSLLTAERVHEILRLMSDADCWALGFDPQQCRPD